MTDTTDTTDTDVADVAVDSGVTSEGLPRWDAFISYSHAADGRLAPALRDGLHRLAKQWFRKRALRIFLDEAAMSAEPALWTSIERALSTSKAFVLLASPEAAASVWVNREVTTWTSNHGTDQLLLVLTDGELEWDDALGDFDPDRSTALPAGLRGVFSEVPRHLDLRWTKESEPDSGHIVDLTLRNPRFLDDVAELAAPLHGRAKDDLVGSDLTEHRRTMNIARAAIVALSLLLIAAVFAASLARSNARRADERRVDAQAARLRGESLATANLPDLSFLLAATAYRMRPSPSTASAVIANSQRVPDLKHLVRAHSSRVIDVAVTDDGRTAVSLDESGGVVAIDTATGKILARARVSNRGSMAATLGSHVLVSALGRATLFDARTLQVRNAWDFGGELVVGAAALEGGRIVFALDDGRIAVGAPDDAVASLRFEQVADRLQQLATSGGSVLVLGQVRNETVLMRIDAPRPNAGGAVPMATRWRRPLDSAPTAVSFTGDRALAVVASSRGLIEFFDAETGEPAGEPLSQPSSVPTAIRAIAGSPYLLVSGQAGDYTYIVPATATRASFGSVRLHQRTTMIGWSPANIAAAGGADGVVAILDTGENAYPTRRVVAPASIGSYVTFDGTRAATLGRDGAVEVHDVRDGAFVNTVAVGNVRGGRIVTLLGAGRASVVADETGRVHLFGLDRGSVPAVLDPPQGASSVAALVPVGEDRVAILWGSTVLQVYLVEGGRLTLERTLSDRASAVGAQGSGGLVAFFEGADAVVVVDPESGTLLARVPISQPGSSALAIDSSGTLVAVADGGQVRVFEVGSGQQLGDPIDGGGEVEEIRFTDGSRRLFIATTRSAVRLVDVVTGESAGRIQDDDGRLLLSLASWTSSEAVVLTTRLGAESRTERWSFDLPDVVRTGCALFDRPFTAAELRTYDLDTDGPCQALDDMEKLVPPAAARSATSPATTERPLKMASQGEAVDQIVAAARLGGAVRDCVRSRLDIEPWISVDEVHRSRNAGRAFTARLAPFVRLCASAPTGGNPVPEVEGIPPFTLDELVERWNTTITRDASSRLGPLKPGWTPGTNDQMVTTAGSGVQVVASVEGPDSSAFTPSLAGGGGGEAFGSSTSVLSAGSDAAYSPRVVALYVVVRSRPDADAMRSVLRSLATVIEGEAIAPSVAAAFTDAFDAVTDAPSDARPKSTPSTTAPVSEDPVTNLRTVRVGRAVYSIARVPAVGQLTEGVAVSVIY